MSENNGSNGNGNSEKNSVPALIPQPNGKGALYSGGVPGNKGGGRKKSEWLAKLEVAMEPLPAVLADILVNGKDADKLQAGRFGAEYLYGKPTQPVELSGGMTTGVMAIPSQPDATVWRDMARKQQEPREEAPE